MKLSTLLSLFLILTSCELIDNGSSNSSDNDSNGSRGQDISIPTVNLSCNTTGTNCAESVDGNYAWIVFLDGDSEIEAQALATVSCNSSTCSASVSSGWVDNNLENIDEMVSDEYTLGVYIDVDGDLTNFASVANSRETAIDVRCVSPNLEVELGDTSISISRCQTVP